MTYRTSSSYAEDPAEVDYDRCFDGARSGTAPETADCDEESWTYYPGAPLPSSQTDASGRTRYMQYDGFGRLATIVDGAGIEERLEYDAKGRIVEWRRGIASRGWRYDHRDRVIRFDNGTQGSLAFTFDARGNLAGETDVLAQTSKRFAYDPLGREIGTEDESGDRVERRYHVAFGLVESEFDSRGDDWRREMRFDLDDNGFPVSIEECGNQE
ncbi:MAG: RHS repeat domain-containing protein, partial [Myxococcota bacterium]